MSWSLLERRTLDALKRALVEHFGARLVGLSVFGSRARGDSHADSDVDIIVVIDSLTAEDRRFAIDQAHDLSVESGLTLSPIVRAPSWLSSGSPLAETIAEEGVAV